MQEDMAMDLGLAPMIPWVQTVGQQCRLLFTWQDKMAGFAMLFGTVPVRKMYMLRLITRVVHCSTAWV